MKIICFLLFFVASAPSSALAEGQREVINLNGTWEFDQTINAFPPQKFTRKIPVPGLVHMAQPKIDDYEKFFVRADKSVYKEQYNLYNIDYTPRYSWYRKKIFIPKEYEGKYGMLTIKKSQYVTQIYINGKDMGSSMECYTPMDFPVSSAIKYGAENEILIKVGDRVWLPSEAAGGTDKEKEHYLPGIWDDVELSFTGKIRVNRLLVLPMVAEKKILVKAQLRSFYHAQIFFGDAMFDSIGMQVVITEKKTGKSVASFSKMVNTKRDNITEVTMDIPLKGFTSWTPEAPFLYSAEVTILNNKETSDKMSKSFGMRDFTRKGKFFYLNGSPYILRGTNITLQRFFEDPDCANLAWDRAWVKKLMIDYPKQLNWNAMRICVGVVPDFWYDLADEYGLLFQNEWFYWQNHGWNDQIRKEYTNWVWSDGCHPSIGIWDGINENWDDYIGNALIPELKKLDPTRIWDAGFMSGDKMNNDEMDEPHPYQGFWSDKADLVKKDAYPLGSLDFKPQIIKDLESSGSAQLVNEYGWIWLWRNGLPSKLTVKLYDSYLGDHNSITQNREFQAYWLQCETEWLRSNTAVAGVMAFCYLTNNYGYTGDWFVNNIKDLQPGLTMQWFKHCFAPVAMFVNLTDERYTKHVTAHEPGSMLSFNLAGINNTLKDVNGNVKIAIVDATGKAIVETTKKVTLGTLTATNVPVCISVPDKTGGYLVTAAFTAEGSNEPVISRRYIKVGESAAYKFYDLVPSQLK